MTEGKLFVDKSVYRVERINNPGEDEFVTCQLSTIGGGLFHRRMFTVHVKGTSLYCDVEPGDYFIYDTLGRRCFTDSELPPGFEELPQSVEDATTCSNCDTEKSAASFHCPHCGYRG